MAVNKVAYCWRLVEKGLRAVKGIILILVTVEHAAGISDMVLQPAQDLSAPQLISLWLTLYIFHPMKNRENQARRRLENPQYIWG